MYNAWIIVEIAFMEISCIIDILSLQQIGQSFAFVYYVGDELVDVLVGCIVGIRLVVGGSVLLDWGLGLDDEFSAVGSIGFGIGCFDAL